jgi:LPXTG-motif cell wall-anchored protein
MRAIDIRDGADRTIRDREVVVYQDLPATAECTLSEVGNGGANVVAMTLNGLPIAGTTLTLSPGTSESVLANTYLLALTGSEPLPWILVGGQLLLVGGLFMFIAGRRRRESADTTQ